MVTLETFFHHFGSSPELLKEGKVSFAQNGEDLMVNGILESRGIRGIFVDIGAYHPFRFSNTFLLYLQGWRGINIDANEEAIKLFSAVRPQDISIQALISDSEEEIEYFKFPEGAWNTTDGASAKELSQRGNPLTANMTSHKMKARTINSILDQHCQGRPIEFLNIDIEGMDTRVLQSLDLSRYRPYVISIELDIARWNSEPLKSYFESIGYAPHAQCRYSAIFIDSKAKSS